MKEILLDSLDVFISIAKITTLACIFAVFALVIPSLLIVSLLLLSGWFLLLIVIYVYCAIVVVKVIDQYKSEIMEWIEK